MYRIKAGDMVYFKGKQGVRMNGQEKYINETDDSLAVRFQNGETEIMDYLLEKYKYLVLKISRKFFLIGGEVDDVLQEGMSGLFKAIRDYDGAKEASFYR